jgi:tetratricopeptide (TPR) repeat protein
MANRGTDTIIGGLLGAAVVLGAALLGLSALDRAAEAPTSGEAPSYRAAGADRTFTPAPLPRAVEFVAGRIGEGDDRARGTEAILRLHGALGLRDVHPGPIALHWAPAYPAGAGDAADANTCAPAGEADPELPSRLRLRSGARADLLDRPPEPHRTLRVSLLVSDTGDALRAVASLCTPRGTRRSQVFEDRAGSEGRILRELITWLASQLDIDEVDPFLNTWGRAPAAPGPPMSAYREVLVESLEPGQRRRRPNPPTLGQAARASGAAAWLAAWLGPRRVRLDRLRQGMELRPTFTAAIEDLAALELERGRTDLALAALERLSTEPERARPTELTLVDGLLDERRAEDARRLLSALPPAFDDDPARARAEARLSLAAGAPAEAEAWTAAWLAAAPAEPEALLLHGDALHRQGRAVDAAASWLQAAAEDARRRPDALARLTAAAIERGDEAALLTRLDAIEDPDVRELRAYAALRQGPEGAARAYRDYTQLLDEAPTEDIAFNACVAAVWAGIAGPDRPGVCSSVAASPWEAAQLEAALGSRQPGLLPNYPPDVGSAVRASAEQAPRAAEAAEALLHLDGPGADADLQRALLARWRVAAGADAIAPSLPEPRDPAEALVPKEPAPR